MAKLSELILAVTNAYGDPEANRLSSAIAKVQAEGNISDFHPDHRPDTLSGIRAIGHFQGFPYYSSSNIAWSWNIPRTVSGSNTLLFLIRGINGGGPYWGTASFDAISYPDTSRIWQEYPDQEVILDENINLYYASGYKNALFLSGNNLKTILSVFQRNSNGSKGSLIVSFEDVVTPGDPYDTSDVPFGSVGVNFNTSLIGSYGIYIETLVEDVVANVLVDYFYSEDLTFLKTNSVETYIEGFDYGQTDNPNISIGTDGTTIITSYEISADDSGELTPPEEIGITLTIRKNNSGGTEIYSGTASSSSASIIPVGRTLTPSDIGTANKIWVSVELAIVQP